MGSRSNTSRAPTQPQIIYVPQSPPPPPPPVSAEQGSTDDISQGASDVQKSDARKQNLLRRDRSRFGTVLSGFRGVLGLSENTQQRKSLLGE